MSNETPRIDVWIELGVPTAFGHIDDIVTIGGESWYIPRIHGDKEEDYRSASHTAARVRRFLSTLTRLSKNLGNARLLWSLSTDVADSHVESVADLLLHGSKAGSFVSFAGGSDEPKIAKERRLAREELAATDATRKQSHEKLVAAWESEEPFSVGLEEMTVREVRLGLESVRDEIERLTRHLEIAQQIQQAALGALDS